MSVLGSVLKGLADWLNQQLANTARQTDTQEGEVLAESLESREDSPQDFLNRLEGTTDRADRLIDGAIGGAFDTLEDDVAEEILRGGNLEPDEIEDLLNSAEGAALEDAIAATAGLYGIEAVGAGQLESGQFLVTQVLSFLALENVLGRRLEMLYSKGVDPALEAEIARQTRSEFVNLQDNVEYHLRNKDTDTDWVEDLDIYGLRPDQTEKIERVSLQQLEPEELLESPAEFGVIPDSDVVEEQLQLSGLPEGTKDLFRDVVEAVPRATTVYEERTQFEELVNQLDTLMADGELDPAEVREFADGLEDEILQELVARYERIQRLPSGAPPRSLIEDSFAYGLSTEELLRERLNRLEYNVNEYDDVVQATILNDLDGRLQDALAYGLISETEFANIAESAGVNDEAIEGLLSGQSAAQILKQAEVTSVPPGERDVQTLSGIGSARSAGLNAGGIQTVGDMAEADVETVSQLAQVSPETALGYINQARLRVGEARLTAESAGVEVEDETEETTTQPTSPGERSVETIIGIGDDRAAALEAVGLGTVGDLASADVETVASEAQVGRETAQQWIDSAQARVNQG